MSVWDKGTIWHSTTLSKFRFSSVIISPKYYTRWHEIFFILNIFHDANDVYEYFEIFPHKINSQLKSSVHGFSYLCKDGIKKTLPNVTLLTPSQCIAKLNQRALWKDQQKSTWKGRVFENAVVWKNEIYSSCTLFTATVLSAVFKHSEREYEIPVKSCIVQLKSMLCGPKG